MADDLAFAHYRVRKDRLDDFLALIAKHEPVLRRLGLITDEPARVYVGEEKDGAPLVIEIFAWAGEDGSARAHTHPEVSEIWEAMGPMCEDRDGRPAFEFPHLHLVDVS